MAPPAPALRTLGRTGLEVSAIGLGLAALGRPGYLNLGHGEDVGAEKGPAALEARTHGVLDAAHAGGVRYLDAARSYGRAEDFLASWLDARRPGDVVVGSKWGYRYTAGWQVDADPPEVKDLSVAHLRTQLAETRARLGAWLALEQIHSATLASGVLADAAVLDELAALRASGVAVGVTTSGPDQAATIDRAVATGAFDTVQATWNLLERSAGEALRRAHAAGLGVVVKEGLANGRLTARGGEERLLAAARARGVAPDALALAAVLARPWVDVVLSGAASEAQLASNLTASAVAWDAGLEAELAPLAEPADAYWRARSGLAWT